MSADVYSRIARWQDLVLEPLNAPLRTIATSMVVTGAGVRVLDVGCGTGKQLERYLEAGCQVSGVDKSPAMLSRARETLGTQADLRLADAQALPHPNASFDVVSATLMVHELDRKARRLVVEEMLRVLDSDGSLLIIDFHVGRLHGVTGRAMRGFSIVAELMARHLSRSRAFLADGGVPALAAELGIPLVSTRVLAGGNLAIYLLTR